MQVNKNGHTEPQVICTPAGGKCSWASHVYAVLRRETSCSAPALSVIHVDSSTRTFFRETVVLLTVCADGFNAVIRAQR